MKNQITFKTRMSEELLRKMCYIAGAEGRTPNNHIIYMIRQNIAYFERTHGKIDAAKLKSVELPDEDSESLS